MIDIQYLPLSSLTPVELKYSYNTVEPLQQKNTTYETGLNVSTLKGTESFQDVSFNNETCLILTSSVSLSAFFNTLFFEKGFFGSVLLQPRRFFPLGYVAYNEEINNLFLSTSATHIYISPVSGINEVELFVNRQYVQVNEKYPYEVTLNNLSLDPESIHRQRFVCTIHNNTISFRTKTNTGERYLAISNDGVMRATGTVLNNAVLNDYIFNVQYIAVNTGTHGFVPVNDFVTYYFDIESLVENKTLAVNKHINNSSTNFLISLPFTDINNNNARINIANLKNIVTPSGGIASYDNSYTKTVITSNQDV
jgi:hypothetical protein